MKVTQWRQPETAQYTGFIIFPKSECSTDFMKALGDGRIKFDLLDVKSQYTPQFTYYRDDGSRSSLTIQYRSVNRSSDSLLMTNLVQIKIYRLAIPDLQPLIQRG